MPEVIQEPQTQEPAPNQKTKVGIMLELHNMQTAISKVRRLIQRATPMADGLTVVKDLDKLLRAVEKVKMEIGSLPI